MILLGIGVGIAIFGRRFLGYGLNPYSHAHVGCGYFACVIALFGLVTNGVRIRQNLARQVTIFIHFAVGLLFYGFSCKFSGSSGQLMNFFAVYLITKIALALQGIHC